MLTPDPRNPGSTTGHDITFHRICYRDVRRFISKMSPSPIKLNQQKTDLGLRQEGRMLHLYSVRVDCRWFVVELASHFIFSWTRYTLTENRISNEAFVAILTQKYNVKVNNAVKNSFYMQMAIFLEALKTGFTFTMIF